MLLYLEGVVVLAEDLEVRVIHRYIQIHLLEGQISLYCSDFEGLGRNHMLAYNS